MLLLMAAVIFMCAHTLLGEYAWRFSNVPPPFLSLATEVLKFIVSIFFFRKEIYNLNADPKMPRFVTASFWYDARYFAIPGGLYFLGNNIFLFALKYLSSHLVGLLSNFKLLVSAVLAALYLKQKFSMFQWISLVLVVTGLLIAVEDPGKKATAGDSGISFDMFLYTFVYSLVTALISAVAGVCCEKLYKTKEIDPALNNVHLQNIKLYGFGILFNLVAFILTPEKYFDGFGVTHILYIIVGGLQGISMGFIMKYLDNVVRGITVAAGSILNTAISITLLGNELTGAFVVGGLITLVSAHAYRNFPSPPDTPEKQDVTPTFTQSSVACYAIILLPLLSLPLFNLIDPISAILKGQDLQRV